MRGRSSSAARSLAIKAMRQKVVKSGSLMVTWARPTTTGVLILTLLYVLVPVRRVPWRAALVGGMLAAIAFDIAKSGFAFYIKHAPTYEIIYGTIAALPIFLIWVYLSWMIVLVGAAISATLAESIARK